MTRIYLVRHCEALGNQLHIFQGHTDCGITENGARQLERLAEKFRTIPLDGVYSSPLERAYDTAKAVARYHPLSIISSPGLIEINGGEWEGKHWEELEEKYPKDFSDWSDRPYAFSAPGGDSMKDVFRRVRDTVLSITRENKGKRVAAVTHGCAIRNFLCFALGYPLERINEVPWCGNTGICVIDFDDNLVPSVAVMNDISHLDQPPCTFEMKNWNQRKEPRP